MKTWLIRDTVKVPSKVITMKPGTTLSEAITHMRQYDIHHLIVAEGEELLGVVSDRDMIHRGVADRSVIINPMMNIGEIMKPVREYVTESTTLDSALDLMNTYEVSALPVMKGGKLVGIITETDLIRLLRGFLKSQESELDAAERSKVLLANPLVQNVMKMVSEAGI